MFCNRNSSKVECPFISKSYKLYIISLIQVLKAQMFLLTFVPLNMDHGAGQSYNILWPWAWGLENSGEKKKVDSFQSSGKTSSQFSSGFIRIHFLEDRTKLLPSCSTKIPTVPHVRLMFIALRNIPACKRCVLIISNSIEHLKQQKW